MSTEAPENTAEKVDLVQIEFEARWDLTVPLSEFGDLSPDDEEDLDEWMHENTDKVLSALDLKLIQGDNPIELGFGGTHTWQGVAPALTEWPDRDPRDRAPYHRPVPSFVSRFNLERGEQVETSPVEEWSDDMVRGAFSSLRFVLGYCSIGERQKSNLMPFWYEVLHAMYSRPLLHRYAETDRDCLYCELPESEHLTPTGEPEHEVE